MEEKKNWQEDLWKVDTCSFIRYVSSLWEREIDEDKNLPILN